MRKIDDLIEESILKVLKSWINKITIPKNIFDKIKKKFRISLEEVAAAPKVDGITTPNDTCYTAVMKLIDKKNLIRKYETLADFMEAYYKKNKPKMLSDVKVENLKPGTILFAKYKHPSKSVVNRGYGKFGLEQFYEVGVGHLMIYMGTDPSYKPKNYVVLGNSPTGDDRSIIGTGLELQLEYYSKTELNKKSPLWDSVCCIEILDYNIIKSM